MLRVTISNLGGWCNPFRGSGNSGLRPGSIGGIPPIPRKSGGRGSGGALRIDFGLGGNIDVPEDAADGVDDNDDDDEGADEAAGPGKHPEFWLMVAWVLESGAGAGGVVVVGVGLSHFSFSFTLNKITKLRKNCKEKRRRKTIFSF